jgi:hypothetical protein
MKAIRIEAYGNPADVLKVVDLPDVGPPAQGRDHESDTERREGVVHAERLTSATSSEGDRHG